MRPGMRHSMNCDKVQKLLIDERDRLSEEASEHLANEHPDQQGDIDNFNIKVMSTFKKPLDREKMEAVKIES